MANRPVYSKPVTLTQAVERGEGEKKQTIKEVKLRKPKAGELRGLRLVEVANADVSSMITVIPRLSEPALTEDEVANMDPGDFANLSVEVAGFLG